MKDESSKKEFYALSKIIKEELKIIRNNNWNSFANSANKNPLVCKKFWKRIETIKNQGLNKNENYPKLIFNNSEYKSDVEKANLIGKLLKDTFTDNEVNKFDDSFKNRVDSEINEFIQK